MTYFIANIKQYNKYLLACLILLVTGFVSAEQNKIKWSWKIERAEFYDSVISITSDNHELKHYQFACDLSDALPEPINDETSATINIVHTEAKPNGLLVITCNVGAHSERIVVIDPLNDEPDALFVKTGSYFVDWRVGDGELLIRYDEPCKPAESKSCDVPFSTVEMPWR